MANGVEVRGNTIRVYFRHNGEKCRETLHNLKPNKENIAFAERLIEQINFEKKSFTFEYSKYFPDSKQQQDNTLKHYIEIYSNIKKTKVAHSTWRGYRAILRTHIEPRFGQVQVDKIDYIDLERWIADDLSNLASKTIKEIIAVFRQVHQLYRTRNKSTIDPTKGITIRMPDSEDPDPFSRDEIDSILDTSPYMNKVQELNLVKFLTWSGVRIYEGLAIA